MSEPFSNRMGDKPEKAGTVAVSPSYKRGGRKFIVLSGMVKVVDLIRHRATQ